MKGHERSSGVGHAIKRHYNQRGYRTQRGGREEQEAVNGTIEKKAGREKRTDKYKNNREEQPEHKTS